MKPWRWPVLLACAALALSAGACSRGGRAERTEFERESERRLAATKAGLDSLAVEIRLRADTSRVRWHEQLDSLESQRNQAGRQLRELHKAGAREWRRMKAVLADMLAAIEAGTDTLKVHLRR